MVSPPAVVAFDVIETVFSLESLRPKLENAGLPGYMLDTWFAQILRDAFALDATGVYRPFSDVARAALEALLAASPRAVSEAVDDVIEGFSELDAHSDVAPAMRALCDADVPVVTLTNGSALLTQKLLERCGLHQFVERVISVDEVKRWKPHQEVYLHCAKAVNVTPSRLALVAAHGWDVHGARRAGLMTGYVARSPFPTVMDRPHALASSLPEVVDQLMTRPE